MTRLLSLFITVIIGGLSLQQSGRLPSATATAVCGSPRPAPGTRSAGQDVQCALVSPVKPAEDVAVAQVSTAAAPTSTRGPIGMNLAAANYYNSQSPFIDRMRIADKWIVRYTGGQPAAKAYREELNLSVDATGLPTSVPDKADSVSTVIQYDDLGTGTTRRYVLLYEGTIWGISGPGVKIVDRKPGQITFTQELFGVQQLNFDVKFDNVHNLHLVREDQLALFKAGKVFNPAFLDRVKLFSPIRFMEWQATNGSRLASWSQRLPVTNYSWGIAEQSVPLEVMVQLANEAHVEPWFCIPAHADDDYVRQFATYVRDNLDPALRPHFEYSNEVWNGSFEQARWATEQGKAMFGADIAWPNEVFYGYRAAQVAQIIRSVSGDRARMVVAVFPNWFDPAQYVFQGIAKVGDASKLFNEYAITTYWGGALGGGDPADHQRVVAWAKAGPAGVDAAFDAFDNGGLLDSRSDSLTSIAASYLPHAALARKYGLDLVAYEGGFGVTAYGYQGDEQMLVVDFLKRMQASPRMGVATKRMADDFVSAGGKELTYFYDVGNTSANGTWGVTKDIYATSPTLDALKAFYKPRD